MAKLVMMEGDSKGAEYHLLQDTVTIGRSVSAEVRVNDDEVSRNHAQILRKENRWIIKDLGSRNGTRVNGKLISSPVPLSAQDEIQIGRFKLVYIEGTEVSSNVPPAAIPVVTDKEKEQAEHKTVAGIPLPKEKVSEEDLAVIEKLKRGREAILNEVRKVIVGQEEVLEQMIIALFSRGHCLVVGVPGLAKTLMVKTLAGVLDLDFKRVQFTPDLMPSDITGTDILQEDPATHERQFKFIKGPVFTNILLADEINRTPPKTQAALLEAMQEYRVTAAGVTYSLPLPFFVLATQNPIEQEGTYPLPEAQLDRFMFEILISYPKKEEEIQIVKSTTLSWETSVKPVLSGKDIMNLQEIVRRVPISDHVVTYATNLVRATRPKEPESPDFVKEWVAWGAGPRAAQYLVLGAKARAVINGRYNVSTNDIKAMAHPVLRHRVFTNFNADSEGISSDDIVDKLLQTVREPDERDYK